MSEYIRKDDVIKIMQNNSQKVNIYGQEREMIDGLVMCLEIAALNTVEISSDEDLVNEAIRAADKAFENGIPECMRDTENCRENETNIFSDLRPSFTILIITIIFALTIFFVLRAGAQEAVNENVQQEVQVEDVK